MINYAPINFAGNLHLDVWISYYTDLYMYAEFEHGKFIKLSLLGQFVCHQPTPIFHSSL